MCDYRALTGDPSDNIPGIPRIGKRTATQLLAGGAHLEDLAKRGRLVGWAGTAIRAQWDDLLTWRRLIRLRTDLPLPSPSYTHQPSGLAAAPEIVGQLASTWVSSWFRQVGDQGPSLPYRGRDGPLVYGLAKVTDTSSGGRARAQ